MDPFLGEIRVFGFTYPPYGWAECNGQLLPISQNVALFSLLRNSFGGDGKSTFGLPDLQGSAAIGQGEGAGLSNYFIGEAGGVPGVTLSQAQIPMHAHQAQATNEVAEVQAPAPDRVLARSSPGYAYQGNTSSDLVQMNFQSTSVVGSGFPHNNMPPAMPLMFCIALQGDYPQRP